MPTKEDGVHDALLHYRDRFPIPQKDEIPRLALTGRHAGGDPRGAAQEYADLWAWRGVRAWSDKWWMMSIEIGDVIAPLIGAPKGSVVMLPNVTTADPADVLRQCLGKRGTDVRPTPTKMRLSLARPTTAGSRHSAKIPFSGAMSGARA